MASLVTAAGVRNQPVHHGPAPGIVAIVFAALFTASIIAGFIFTGNTPFPTPYTNVATIQYYFLTYGWLVKITAMLQFGAAVPLGIFTAAVTSRLKFLGVTASGVSIALFGGIASSIFLALSGLCSWVLAQPGIADDAAAMHAIQLLAFATGGVGHVAMLGLLIAGICIPSLFGRFLPRGLIIMGLILAVLAELSTLSMVLPAAFFLLPLACFPAFMWMIAAGFTLQKVKQ
jgi:hypothetical protein